MTITAKQIAIEGYFNGVVDNPYQFEAELKAAYDKNIPIQTPEVKNDAQKLKTKYENMRFSEYKVLPIVVMILSVLPVLLAQFWLAKVEKIGIRNAPPSEPIFGELSKRRIRWGGYIAGAIILGLGHLLLNRPDQYTPKINYLNQALK